MRFIPLIVFLVAFSSVIVAMTIGMISSINEWPYNPLRWAQERRRQANRRRLNRISDLEHELGYRPCSDDTCRPCQRDTTTGHPIWDNPALPAPPPMVDYMVQTAFTKELEYKLRKRGGTSSGGPR
jgi:hypothetical protein